jgi:hypothetical protein
MVVIEQSALLSSRACPVQRPVCHKDDLLLLHVTRFGTIDHALVMPDPLVDYRLQRHNRWRIP